MSKRTICKIQNCEKFSVRKGQCYQHFRENYPEEYRFLLITRKDREKCKVPNCDNMIQRKGFCKTHLKEMLADTASNIDDRYAKWFQKKYHGDPEYRQKYLERKHTQFQQIIKDSRYNVLNHYSNNTMKCLCCGESNPDALTIDHINKRSLDDVLSGYKFYRWLIINNYPEGYRTWCYNCNCSRGRMKTDYCPLHQASRPHISDLQLKGLDYS